MMTYSRFTTYVSYSQICVFVSSLEQPFNDWGDRHFSQGFSWRENSVSFRTLEEAGNQEVHLYINEPVPGVDNKCVRAFKVPFRASSNEIEIGSISNSKLIHIEPSVYILQIEFFNAQNETTPIINIRLNKGDTDCSILKSDEQIVAEGKLDLLSYPAS